MTKWEYITPKIGEYSFGRQLDEYGNEGWELVYVGPRESGVDYWVLPCVLKRPQVQVKRRERVP